MSAEALDASMPDPADIVEAVRFAVSESMPYASLILDAMRPEPTWTPLPPGTHLRLGDDDKRGVGVVAVRTVHGTRWKEGRYLQEVDYSGEHGEVLTERGDVIVLGENTRLRVGR